MIERFEFASDFRGPMARLTWNNFEVLCSDWPGSLFSMLSAGCLGPQAAQEAESLLEALRADY